jgi:hypothetical protein
LSVIGNTPQIVFGDSNLALQEIMVAHQIRMRLLPT